MAYNFGNPKTATGLALPTSTISTSGFQFAGAAGDARTTSSSIIPTFTPTPTGVIAPSTTSAPLSFNLPSATTTAQFGLGATTTTPSSSLSFSLSTTTAPSLLNVSTPIISTSSTAITSSVFSLSTKPAISTTTASSTASTSSVSITTATTTTSSTATGVGTVLGSVNVLTFSQLEDNINKWTIYLEDEGKHYSNQAKQINAWDRLLITNGEKILSLSNGIERVKQQQEQLDQELDFVLAQQKELEDLILPLEKELGDIPVTDLDRHRTYQMAETLDTQLKQMSEDLKEIIEHLNESNKCQEMANPIIQIGRILNVHMNSLQWIDRNTTKITTHLDQIAKMHDLNKRNHEINLQKTYE